MQANASNQQLWRTKHRNTVLPEESRSLCDFPLLYIRIGAMPDGEPTMNCFPIDYPPQPGDLLDDGVEHEPSVLR